MHPLNPFLSLLILLLAVVNPSQSARSTAAFFCKCICFNNSTIIALNPPPSTTSASSLHYLDIRSPHALAAENESPDSGSDEENKPATPSRQHHTLTCADCTRAFCLDYNLPICKNAREEDIFTTCFRTFPVLSTLLPSLPFPLTTMPRARLLKDETVVVIFIFATAGLLAWALVKPWIDRLRERNTFTPLGQHDREQSNSAATATPNAARVSKAPRRTEFGDGGSGTDTRSRQGGGNSGAGPYDEDMHADQDAIDIVSGMPSGSRFRS